MLAAALAVVVFVLMIVLATIAAALGRPPLRRGGFEGVPDAVAPLRDDSGGEPPPTPRRRVRFDPAVRVRTIAPRRGA